ncbi:rho GTPase-activating protein 45 [Puma concolor]|uniref:Rho GTPase-activating protein 45 n=1 Tax=Puma concolor TaxID=9696 RepID=A0A6P6H8M2_PUMCO|nr:rho GTPase-activating protein 45 [Puma concolor]
MLDPPEPRCTSGETEAVPGPEHLRHPPPPPSQELPRKDGADVSLGPSLEPPGAASNAKATGTLKRPTSLSRHASAAGFPLSGSSTWTLGRGHRSPLTTTSPAELPPEGPCPDTVEDISHLLADVGRFAEGLEKLKECVLHEDLLEARRPLAHECLGEALRVMRQIISRFPLLNTVETLTAAGTLIAKIRAFHYECNNESDKREFEKALETIAVSFSSTVSEFLMGEVDSSTLLSVPPGDPSQTMESLYSQGSEGSTPSTDDLPEPLISFRLYHELVGLAKDSLKAEAEAKAASRGRPDAAESEAAAVAMAGRLRERLQGLPPENRATLRYLLRHLRRIVEVEQDNKMTPGNLGIVFGPTLLRPRPTEATVSLSSLVDYPHQARIVETLIAHYDLVFEEEPEEDADDRRAEDGVQAPCPEAGAGAALPLREEAADGGPESQVASNDSDSEGEEASELPSPAGRGAYRLSFLEKQGSEASVEEAQGSSSEEQLGAGAGEGLAEQLSEFNTNQCNNVAEVGLPVTWLHGGQIAAGTGHERQPEFV